MAGKSNFKGGETMSALDHLKPQNVWTHFEAICSIPHPSRHEARVAEYVISRAKSLGFSHRRDEVGNVLIEVPATAGREKAPVLVLQGHLDMVPVAAPGVSHDFEKDPIQPYADKDFVRAKGTTLGADNGIGVAMMLAIMEDKTLIHGPLELLFTINEESGMDGAHGLKADFLKGRKLINLDTEEWGEYYISCAGGGDSIIRLPIRRESLPSKASVLSLKVEGLKGGHSGVDINSGRGSGNKILARCLACAWDRVKFQIVSIRGGNKRNSIADGAEAILAIPASKLGVFKKAAASAADVMVAEFEKTDPGLIVSIKDLPKIPDNQKPVTRNHTQKIIRLLIGLPHGVITMSPEVAGLVETSTNLGVMESQQESFVVNMLSRSAVTSHLDMMKQQIRTIAALFGAKVEEPRGYPGWKPNLDSPLLKLSMDVFKKLHGSIPKVKAIHAGLECGLFSEKLPGVDMISLGPEMHNVHSPAEELNIPSVDKTYELLGQILKAIV